MLKVGRRQWLLLLSGLWLIAVFLLGGIEALQSNIPLVYAAGEGSREDTTDCTGALRTPFFDSDVVVNSGEVICSNLTSFGGTVAIEGEVRGNVVIVDGDVVINGKVNGNVTLYGGNLTIQDGAHVEGDIHLCGGQWMGTASRLHGSLFECTKDAGVLLVGDGGISFRFWSILTWVALGALLTLLLPEHVMLVRTTVQSKMRRSFVLGLLTILLAPVVLTVLVALIISIPLAIIVAVGLIAAWALGTVAIGWLVGEYIIRRVAPHHNTRLVQVVVGSAVLALAGSLPYIGVFISVGAGLLGIGAVFLSRFGTRLYSPPRQPLSL